MKEQVRRVKNLSELEAAKKEHEQLLLGIDLDDIEGEDEDEQSYLLIPHFACIAE